MEKPFLLSFKNVVDYLVIQKLWQLEEQYPNEIKSKSCKNFNLLVSFSSDRHFLVKQECHDKEGKTNGEFLHEWRFQQLLQTFPELIHIRPLVAEAIHFDPICSIIVFNYYNDYCDLRDFYTQEHIFPTEIAASIGASLAVVHRSTIDCQRYKDFFCQSCKDFDKPPNLLRGLERLTPKVFGRVCIDGLKFFELYQRYDSLGRAIAELHTAFQACCLTHDDLKLDNILLYAHWQQASSTAEPLTNSIVRLIDWERCSWGDPAYDLGTIVANYLKIWLSSLVITTDLDVETALHLATTPFDVIHPSIVALTKAYLARFPEIVERRPDFYRRVVQFTGFALIKKIQLKLHHQEPFDNIAICMLQVAKTLLCEPEQSNQIVFGSTVSELTSLSRVPA
ncbi:aminoglycoside phosphotransferase [Nostoc minutum NIES-26]|uniref:Aminoglycoside phosphotransferase n=1 Tax=Nostoc minutum NIES-26 TaxID=1844469 RepID=A0A367QN31_9NOSO|nr:aminoglycoside phosphotransferase [Nostoc minutum NIES-26]